MKKTNSNKGIQMLGNVSHDGKDHQSGYVVGRGGYYQQRTQDSSKTRLRPSENGDLIILGAIGNTARQNRDNMRIFDRRGQCPTLKSHISKESIMVVRKYG